MIAEQDGRSVSSFSDDYDVGMEAAHRDVDIFKKS